MQLDKIVLKDFMSYKDETINLQNVSIAAVVGENGSGKSSILEAITFCFFGQTRAKSDDELSHGYNNLTKEWKCEKFSVEIEFTIGKLSYNIHRIKTESSTKLYFRYIDAEIEQLGGATGKETQAKINSILGMDYESFIASVVLTQNEYAKFLEASPAECKRVLMRIIGIEEFEHKVDALKKLESEVLVEFNTLTEKIQSIKEELLEIENVDDDLVTNETVQKLLNKELIDLEATLEALNTRYLKVKANYESQGENLRRLKEIERETNKLDSQITEIENGLEETLDTAGGDLEKILENKDKLNDLAKDLDSKQPVLYKDMGDKSSLVHEVCIDIKKSKEQIEKLQTKICDKKQVCLMKKEECNTQWRSQIEEEISVLKKDLVKFESKKVQFEEEHHQSVESHNRNVEKLKKVRAAKEVVSDHSTIKVLKDSRKNLEKEKAKIEDIEIGTETTDEDVSAMEIQVRKKKIAIKEKREALAEKQTEAGVLKGKKDRKESLEERLAGVRDRRDLLKTKKSVYEVLVRAFGRDGIPAVMVQNIVPILEKDANETLERLSGGKINLEFRLEKKLKGGGFSDSFEVFITDEAGTRSARMYSGGERFRVVFALHSSFSKYLTRRSKTEIKLLVIDEPSGLDEDGLAKLIETLGVMKEFYSQIFVISHLKELIDSFENVLYVEKDEFGSHVKQKQLMGSLEDEI